MSKRIRVPMKVVPQPEPLDRKKLYADARVWSWDPKEAKGNKKTVVMGEQKSSSRTKEEPTMSRQESDDFLAMLEANL